MANCEPKYKIFFLMVQKRRRRKYMIKKNRLFVSFLFCFLNLRESHSNYRKKEFNGLPFIAGKITNLSVILK